MKNPFGGLFKKNKKGGDAIAPDTGTKPKKKGFLENFLKNRMGKKAAQGEDVVGVELTPSEIRLAQLTSNKSNQWVLEKFFVHKVEGMPDGGSVLDNPDILECTGFKTKTPEEFCSEKHAIYEDQQRCIDEFNK